MKTRPTVSLAQQTGFTLVELMISLVLSLLIVLALVTLLINVNRSNSDLTSSGRMLENGRFAMQILENDIQHAGYWGGYVPAFDDLTTVGAPSDVPTDVPDPCLDYSALTTAEMANLIGVAVQSYEIPATVPSPTLSVCASLVVSPKSNTDVLFVRHTETCTAGSADCMPLDQGNLYFQLESCGDAVPSPAYAMSPYASATVGTDFPRQARSASAPSPACTSAALRKFDSSLYYIRNFADTAGDGIPTLVRSQLGVSSGTLAHQVAQPLIEGVEGFRVEFGIDNVSRSGAPAMPASAIAWAASHPTEPTNRGDGVPDGSFIRCTTALPCTAAQLMHVVAVKLYILVRSENATPGYTDTKTYQLGSTTLGPFGDGFKRHLFSQTLRLTNVAARRETP
jgi:type IV pilus assembly protein PilW